MRHRSHSKLLLRRVERYLITCESVDQLKGACVITSRKGCEIPMVGVEDEGSAVPAWACWSDECVAMVGGMNRPFHVYNVELKFRTL